MAPACVNMLTHIILILLLCSDADGCFKFLEIITPTPMEALSGSCLHIPCTFKPVSESKKINIRTSVVGIWFKTKWAYSQTAENVISISGNPSKTYPMIITGNLKKTECTTLFSNLSTKYTDKYYFRVENSGFTAIDVCHPLEIKVKGKTHFCVCFEFHLCITLDVLMQLSRAVCGPSGFVLCRLLPFKMLFTAI